MAYDPNQQYQQPQYQSQPQYPPPGQGYQQPPPGYQPGYPPPGYQQPVVAQNPLAQQLGPSSIGIDANIAAALSYFWIIGLIFFLIEKKNRFVRFHALQSISYGVGFWILGFIFDTIANHIFFLFGCLGGLLWVVWVIGAIYAAVQAYNGKWFQLPVVGSFAYKNASSWVPPEGGMAGPGMPGTQYPPQGGYPPQQPGYPPQGQYPQQPPPGQWPQQ